MHNKKSALLLVLIPLASVSQKSKHRQHYRESALCICVLLVEGTYYGRTGRMASFFSYVFLRFTRFVMLPFRQYKHVNGRKVLLDSSDACIYLSATRILREDDAMVYTNRVNGNARSDGCNDLKVYHAMP